MSFTCLLGSILSVLFPSVPWRALPNKSRPCQSPAQVYLYFHDKRLLRFAAATVVTFSVSGPGREDSTRLDSQCGCSPRQGLLGCLRTLPDPARLFLPLFFAELLCYLALGRVLESRFRSGETTKVQRFGTTSDNDRLFSSSGARCRWRRRRLAGVRYVHQNTTQRHPLCAGWLDDDGLGLVRSFFVLLSTIAQTFDDQQGAAWREFLMCPRGRCHFER